MRGIRPLEPEQPIARNAARCLGCGQTIVSQHVHDFVTCRCGKISVDGGQEYLRRAQRPGARYVECSEYVVEIPEALEPVWPAHHTTSLHASKEHCKDIVQENPPHGLGMTGQRADAFYEKFRGCLEDVEFDLLVREDGTYVIEEIRDGGHKFRKVK